MYDMYICSFVFGDDAAQAFNEENHESSSKSDPPYEILIVSRQCALS